jgi:putative transposase
MCALFDVSRSGYYDWLNHEPGKRELANQELDKKIKLLHEEHKMRYGVPRITRALQALGELCGHNRVARRMQNMGLKAIAKRKFKATTDSEHSKPIYDNVLNRDFNTTGINQKWCSDITYIRTNEGWLYLAVVIDLHSRAIIGWSMDKTMKQELVCDALSMALLTRGFPANVIVHSDRGSQYCSNKYRDLIKKHNLIGSMSREGNCWDNAIAETFFHTFKVELIYECKYLTREMAKLSIFHYIEHYYNRKRMHSSIDYMTPNEVELLAA